MRVTPSQVVATAYAVFPGLDQQGFGSLGQGHRGPVATLVQMLDRIPAQLIVAPPEELLQLNIAVEAMRSAIATWLHREEGLGTRIGLNDRHVIQVLVAMQWFWSYLTFRRGARLITGSEGEM